MSFTVKVKMNSISKIIKEHGLERDGATEKFLRDEVDKFCDPYIPMDVGNLKDEKTYPNNHSIKYTSPYAHYMYKGKVYISPKLGVSGIVLKNGRWWSPSGEKKIKTNRRIKYQGAPKRGAEWDKRMINERIHDIEKDLKNFIKRGGK